MAHVGNKGFFILNADAAPTFDPTGSFVGGVASVAGTEILYFHQTGTTWSRVDISALSGPDGNNTVVVRTNATLGTAPTVAEVPAADLANGDTASVYLNNGTLEYWAYNGTAWSLAFTTDAETLADALVTLSGLPAGSTDLGTFTGTTLADGLTIKQAIQALETALEGIDVPIDTVSNTNTINLTVDAADDLTADLRIDVTQDNEFELTESATGVRITKQVLPSYASVAAALADTGLAVGDAYHLDVTNLEGVTVPVQGKGPVFRK